MIREHWQSWLTKGAAPGTDADPDRSGPAESAMQHESGIAYLPDLAVVRFTGADARKFLQGYLTCDVEKLTEGALTHTALCNLKGRVVMNGWCAPADHDVLLVLHNSLVDDLAAFLRAYLMFSKTRLVRPEVLVLGTLDRPDASGALKLDERRRLYLCDSVAEAQRIWGCLPHLSPEAWLTALTLDGIPLVSQPVSQTFLPQMLNLQTLGAVDFGKGCYLGQEVVARAQHRGQVKRQLARLLWTGAEAPTPGAEITDPRQRTVGVVVQSVAGSVGSGTLLAVLQQDAQAPLLHGATRLERI
jgi:tRNA-modifying protein YgfZ